jgi:hypothetical protein
MPARNALPRVLRDWNDGDITVTLIGVITILFWIKFGHEIGTEVQS